jgi:hypothetical protein
MPDVPGEELNIAECQRWVKEGSRKAGADAWMTQHTACSAICMHCSVLYLVILYCLTCFLHFTCLWTVSVHDHNTF